VLAVPLLAVVGLLAGCSAAGSSPAAGPAEDRGEVAPVPASGEVPGDVGSSLDRKIARTATISLVIDDVAATAAQLRGVAQSVGGIVTDELLQLPVPDDASRPWGTTSTVVLSVPATALDRTLDLAAGLGEVTDRTISSTDVTDEVVDVDARVTTMRESIARLQELMDRAGSVSEIARVESELTSRQAELESLLARQKALSAMVETSPVTVTLTPRAIAVPKAPDGFLSGLAAGWNALVNTARVAATALGAMLPFLAIIAVVVVPLLVLRRRRVRAARQAAAGEPGTGHPTSPVPSPPDAGPRE
jgi:hypothetical protein